MRWSPLLPITLALATGCTFGTVRTKDNFPALVAEEQPAAPILVADAQNPPGRVAHLDFFKGAVSYQPAESEDWAPAIANLPLKTGDRLWSGADGRVELHAGATALRLDHDTEVTILRLDDRVFQIGVSRGTVQARVPGGDRVELDTPSGALVLASEGSFRVDVDPYRPADLVQMRSGRGELSAGGETLTVVPGGAIRLQGGEAPWYDNVAATAADAFEGWCGDRDRREEASESGKRLGRQMTGFQELDGHGKWSYSAELGPVWSPAVAPGWAPYRAGRWLWVNPWGWTWVDDAPWAFTPSHYGRWALLDGAWAWVPLPDPLAAPPAHPVYAPALVAFLGGSGVRGTAPGQDGTAWFPLGPREAYEPAYPASAAYRQALNPWPARTGPPAYRNQGLPRALTFMARAALAQGLPAPASGTRSFGLGRATVLGGAPALAPGAGGFRPGAAPGQHVAQPPPGSPYRALVTRTPPPTDLPDAAPAVLRRLPAAPASRFQVPTRPAEPLRGEAPLRPLLAPLPPAPPAARPEPPTRPAPGTRPATGTRPTMGTRPASPPSRPAARSGAGGRNPAGSARPPASRGGRPRSGAGRGRSGGTGKGSAEGKGRPAR